jgi:cell division protein FtsB
MPYHKDIEPLSKQLTIVIGLTVVGFMAFGLALSYYRNIIFDKTLASLQTDNDKLAAAIVEGQRDLEYYQSDQFKDKYAKENLGKADAGEKMIVLNEPHVDTFVTDQNNTTDQTRRDAAYFQLLQQMPVLEQWNLFFFNRDKIDTLKQAL